VEYAFDDWSGREDVLTLCQSCIQELEKVISDRNSKLLIPR
jgi:hypothetical protein